MTILVESLDEMEDVTVVDNLGDSKAYFSDHLSSFKRTKQQIISNSDSFHGGSTVRSCMTKWIPLLSVTVVTVLSSNWCNVTWLLSFQVLTYGSFLHCVPSIGSRPSSTSRSSCGGGPM
jgi:hypothetical protein